MAVTAAAGGRIVVALSLNSNQAVIPSHVDCISEL